MSQKSQCSKLCTCTGTVPCLYPVHLVPNRIHESSHEILTAIIGTKKVWYKARQSLRNDPLHGQQRTANSEHAPFACLHFTSRVLRLSTFSHSSHKLTSYAAITECINHQLMLYYCLPCGAAKLLTNVSESS